MNVPLPCGLTVELALTEDQWEHGLSGRESMGTLDGMLFVFQESKQWPVYALDLCCTLYIYWLNEYCEVVAEAVLDRDSSVYLVPILSARYLLEVKYPMPWTRGTRVNLGVIADEPTRTQDQDS